jgi:hypothetical protein
MKRLFAAVAAALMVSVSLHADITINSTVTIEGGPMGAQTPGPMTQVMRLKGMKSRMEMDGMGRSMVLIADMATKKVYLLDAATKTAQVLDSALAVPAGAGDTMPQMDASVTPTGQSRSINQMSCQEYSFTMTMNMAEMAGAQLPPEAAEMMKGMTMAMKGSIWAAKDGPGAREFAAFSKAAVDLNLGNLLAGGVPGKTNPAMQRLVEATARASGVPCLTEMNMTVQGEGPMADMMRQSGAMKTTVKTTSVSTETLPDDLFAVPADYKITKQ